MTFGLNVWGGDSQKGWLVHDVWGEVREANKPTIST